MRTGPKIWDNPDDPEEPLEADDYLDQVDFRRYDYLDDLTVGQGAPFESPDQDLKFAFRADLQIEGYERPEDGRVVARFAFDVPNEIAQALAAVATWGVGAHPDVTFAELLGLACDDNQCPAHLAALTLGRWVPRSAAVFEEAAAVTLLIKVAQLVDSSKRTLLMMSEWIDEDLAPFEAAEALGISSSDFEDRLEGARQHLRALAQNPEAWPVRSLADRLVSRLGRHPGDPMRLAEQFLEQEFDEPLPRDFIGLLVTGFCGYVRDGRHWGLRS